MLLLPMLVAPVLAPPAGAAEWEAVLPPLVPALRGCLAGDPAAFAILAEPFGAAAAGGEGRVTIRLWRGGAAEDCVADASGRVLRRDAVPGAAPPDPAATAYFLERRCVDARRVDAPRVDAPTADASAKGAPEGGTPGAALVGILGWIAYPACG